MSNTIFYLMEHAAVNDRALRHIVKTLRIQNKFNCTMLLGYLLLGLGYMNILRDLSKMQAKVRDLESTV